MRKVFLTMVAVSALWAVANAQVHYGLKAGVNLAKLKVSAGGVSVSTDSRVGFNAGFFVTAPVAPNVNIQPELLYSMEGGKVEDEASNTSVKINLAYVNIPLLLQYSASGAIIETGPQFGVLVSATGIEDNESIDIKEDLKTTAFSWAIGAGYRLPGGLGFHARYNLGLSNLDKEPDGETTTKSNVLQFSLSLAFGGGNK